MSRRTGNGRFQKGESGNPGGRPKLPADIREAFKAKAPEALEVLTRCLQSDDDRIAMMAAQAILDRGYGKPTQSIDARTGWPDGSLYRRDASQGREHRGLAQGQCGVPSVDQTGGRSLISWIDIRIARQCLMLMGPISPRPRHRSWEGTGTRQLLFEDRVRYYRRDARQGQDHRGWLKGNAAYLASTKLGGRSLISWDRYSDSSAVLAAYWVPSHPAPGINRGKVPVP